MKPMRFAIAISIVIAVLVTIPADALHDPSRLLLSFGWPLAFADLIGVTVQPWTATLLALVVICLAFWSILRPTKLRVWVLCSYLLLGSAFVLLLVSIPRIQ